MKFISLGEGCNVKYQLDKFFGKKETLFFDRLETSMDSVNTIIACKDISEILFFENIVQNTKNLIHNNNAQMLVHSLNKCISKHDINKNITKKGIDKFIAKYTRRFHRIQEYIKGGEKVIFIRFNKITKQEKEIFIKSVKKTNIYCNFMLVNIIIDQKESSLIKEANFIEINLIDSYQDDWTGSYINWEEIFNILAES